MKRLPFHQLPRVAKFAVGLAFNNAWWSIEEFVINRKGLWKYMPLYKVDDPCVWDLAVLLITVFGLWQLSRRGAAKLAEGEPAGLA